MFIFNVNRILQIRGITHAYRFLLELGFSASFASSLVQKKVRRVDFSRLEKLCKGIQCTPNDLVEWIPDENEDVQKSHFLYSLYQHPRMQIKQQLDTLPPAKLSEVLEYIESIKKTE